MSARPSKPARPQTQSGPARGRETPTPPTNKKSHSETNEGVLMELKIDEGLAALLETGKRKGYLTYAQVNDYLPDDAVNPEKLDQLLLVLEEKGIELIDESEAEEREAGPAGATPENDEARGELDLSFMDEEDT